MEHNHKHRNDTCFGNYFLRHTGFHGGRLTLSHRRVTALSLRALSASLAVQQGTLKHRSETPHRYWAPKERAFGPENATTLEAAPIPTKFFASIQF